MDVIDEDGRLFGAVNVVDALVVLVVFAVALAGIALVAGGDTTETETRYITLDFGTQPDFVTEQIDVGDTSTLETGFGNMTITDTYLTAADSGVRAVARVAVTGRLTEDRFTFDSTPLRFGRTLVFQNDTYTVKGTIQAIGEETTLSTRTRSAVLRMKNVSPERADSVEAGLTETNAGQTVARVLDVRVEPAMVTVVSDDGNIYQREHPINKDVTLTVELRVRERASRPQFKGQILQEGNEVILDLGTTTIRATVVDLGDT